MSDDSFYLARTVWFVSLVCNDNSDAHSRAFVNHALAQEYLDGLQKENPGKPYRFYGLTLVGEFAEDVFVLK